MLGNKQYQRGAVRKRKAPVPVWSLVAIAALVLIGVSWLAYSHFHRSPHSTAVVNAPSSATQQSATSPEKSQAAPSSSNPSTNSTPSTKENTPDASNQPSSANGPAPKAPYGDFVSSHNPPASNTPEQSVCNTTPGATCEISFTKGSTTKVLQAETTDSNGSAYWSWTPSQLGLDSGSWQIKATAKLNNQTVSTTDAKALVVP